MRELEKLIAIFTPKIRDAFLQSIEGIVDRVILADVIEAIRAGDVEAAFRALGYSEAAMRPLTRMIEEAFETGGIAVGGTFPAVLNTPSGRTVFRFDVRNSRAEKWLRETSSRLVVEIEDDLRIGIRNKLFDGTNAGNNPRQTALDIVGRISQDTDKRSGGIVGLTQSQERWVANTRRDLENLDARYFTRELRNPRYDKIVQRAIDTGKPLTKDQVTQLTTAYENNALRYRGNAIGRSETIEALNRADFEATSQAIDMGAAKPGAVKRYWDSAGKDGRTRDSHLDLDKMPPVGLNEPFTTASGVKLMFPGDRSTPGNDPKKLAAETINCRCRVRTDIDWLAGVK